MKRNLKVFSYKLFGSNKGAQVTALVRDVSRLNSDMASSITVIQGNSTVKEDVEKAVDGQDAVIVTLGTRNDLSKFTLKLNPRMLCI